MTGDGNVVSFAYVLVIHQATQNLIPYTGIPVSSFRFMENCFTVYNYFLFNSTYLSNCISLAH